MKQYASLRKKHKSILAPAVMLALCVLLSGAMLFSRLVAYTPASKAQYIPLTVTSGITKVQTGFRDENGNVQPGDGNVTMAVTPMASTMDNTQSGSPIWIGMSDLELFHMEYENESGEVTVSSQNGDKLVAPGTKNTYTFTLQNTAKIALDYTMTMEAYFTMGINTIPLNVRLLDHKGNYVLGDETGMADIMELNSVSVTDSISSGYIAPFTLEWEWPFEGDDAVDTALGDLKVDVDAALNIVIKTVAESGSEGGIPDTGDRSQLYVMTAMMLSSLAAFLLLLLWPRKKKDDEDDKHE